MPSAVSPLAGGEVGARSARLPLEIRRLGRVGYGEALALQEQLRDARLAGAAPDTVLLLEHPDVVTFGSRSDPRHALPEAELRARGYEVFRVHRGGDVTWHGPGQLVGYPILDLEHHGRDLHVYLRALEGVLIKALADFGIAAHRREGYTGVWLDERRKIGSIGVGVRRWVTTHGFALNVCCDTSRFDAIVPCGLRGVAMASMLELVGPVAFDAVVTRVAAGLRKAFG